MQEEKHQTIGTGQDLTGLVLMLIGKLLSQLWPMRMKREKA